MCQAPSHRSVIHAAKFTLKCKAVPSNCDAEPEKVVRKARKNLLLQADMSAIDKCAREGGGQ